MPTATPRETVLFDIQDFKIQPLIGDDPTVGAPVYGDVYDVPGIAQVQVSPTFVTAELKGDAKVLARKGRTTGFTINATYSLLSLDVLSILFGGSIADTSPTSGDQVDWTLNGTNELPYFLASFIIEDVSTGIGDCTCVLYKCQVTGGDLFNQQTDNFGQHQLQIATIPLLSNDKMIDVTIHTVLTPLAEQTVA